MSGDLNNRKGTDKLKAAMAAGIVRGDAKRVPPLVRAYPESARSLAAAMDLMVELAATGTGSLYEALYGVLSVFADGRPSDKSADELDAALAETYTKAEASTDALLQAIDNARSWLAYGEAS